MTGDSESAISNTVWVNDIYTQCRFKLTGKVSNWVFKNFCQPVREFISIYAKYKKNLLSCYEHIVLKQHSKRADSI